MLLLLLLAACTAEPSAAPMHRTPPNEREHELDGARDLHYDSARQLVLVAAEGHDSGTEPVPAAAALVQPPEVGSATAGAAIARPQPSRPLGRGFPAPLHRPARSLRREPPRHELLVAGHRGGRHRAGSQRLRRGLAFHGRCGAILATQNRSRYQIRPSDAIFARLVRPQPTSTPYPASRPPRTARDVDCGAGASSQQAFSRCPLCTHV